MSATCPQAVGAVAGRETTLSPAYRIFVPANWQFKLLIQFFVLSPGAWQTLLTSGSENNRRPRFLAPSHRGYGHTVDDPGVRLIWLCRQDLLLRPIRFCRFAGFCGTYRPI